MEGLAPRASGNARKKLKKKTKPCSSVNYVSWSSVPSFWVGAHLQGQNKTGENFYGKLINYERNLVASLKGTVLSNFTALRYGQGNSELRGLSDCSTASYASARKVG